MTAWAMLACAAGAWAHISLPAGGATTGSDYEAAFRVSHPCEGARATTGITVGLPKGFVFTRAQARQGWTLAIPRAGQAGGAGGEVRWTADSPDAAVTGHAPAEFVVRGKVTAPPGPLYFKVLQRCDTGDADWAELPGGTTGDKRDFPAPRLDVLAPGVAPVDVRDAWVRPTVPGQSGTGAFMKLEAPSGTRLVGVSTPVAGVAEVHTMKLEGDVMTMRALKGGLALPPRQTVELRPAGDHVMLMDLRQPLPRGASVPMTLHFEDAKGTKTSMELTLPVGAPDPAAAAPMAHMH